MGAQPGLQRLDAAVSACQSGLLTAVALPLDAPLAHSRGMLVNGPCRRGLGSRVQGGHHIIFIIGHLAMYKGLLLTDHSWGLLWPQPLMRTCMLAPAHCDWGKE